MKTRTKGLLIAFLSIGALASWVPQLARRTQEAGSDSTLASVPAAAEQVTVVREGSLERPTGSRNELEEPSSDDRKQGDEAHWLAKLDPGALRNFGGGRSSPGVTRSIRRGERGHAETAGPDASEESRRVRAAEFRRAVDELLSRKPLSGILHGGPDSMAILGDWVVREGDSVPETDLLLLRIERRWIELSRDQERTRVDLPPLGSRRLPPASESAGVPGAGGNALERESTSPAFGLPAEEGA
jgi:hypothetical protein